MHYIVETQAWIKSFVIGLNLCPFAKHPFQQDSIRYVLCEVQTQEALLQKLYEELLLLQKTPHSETETTVLIHPNVLQDFNDYNEFLAIAEALLEDLELEGIIQIASFHPDYQFADAATDAVENYTNRAPYPMLHLLREASVTQAIEHYPDVDSIPEQNIANLRRLGISTIKSRLNELKRTH